MSDTLDENRRNEDGFTLVELMVVIVIIGLLATVVIINVLPSQDRAMTEKTKADIALIEQSLDRYRLDHFTYPKSEEGLQSLMTAPASVAQTGRYPNGGYLRRLPNDPWGRPYQYRVPGRQGPFDVFSFGADGQEGGDGENADIGNWG